MHSNTGYKSEAPKPTDGISLGTNIVNTLLGLIGFAVTVLSADFVKPWLHKFPSYLAWILGVLFLACLLAKLIRRRALTHWSVVSSGLGFSMSIIMLALAHFATPKNLPDLGYLAVKSDTSRKLQVKLLPLQEGTRTELQVLMKAENNVIGTTPTPTSPVTSPPKEVQVTKPQDQQSQMPDVDSTLKVALSSDNPDTRESSAEKALDSTSDPGKFRQILRTLFRTGDPVLREIVILREFKTLEGQQLPLSVLDSTGDPNVTRTQTSDLGNWLSGSILTVRSVDLRSSTVEGTLRTGRDAPIHGTVTSSGIQFTSNVYPNGNLGNSNLQITFSAKDDGTLVGNARATVNSNPMNASVQLALPLF